MYSLISRLPLLTARGSVSTTTSTGGITAENINANDQWSIDNFLQNVIISLKKWGGYIVILVGVVMIICAVYQIAKGLISHGKTQVNWVVAILLLIIGGAFAAGGWDLITNIAGGGANTINDLGTQTWLPYYLSFFK